MAFYVFYDLGVALLDVFGLALWHALLGLFFVWPFHVLDEDVTHDCPLGVLCWASCCSLAVLLLVRLLWPCQRCVVQPLVFVVVFPVVSCVPSCLFLLVLVLAPVPVPVPVSAPALLHINK